MKLLEQEEKEFVRVIIGNAKSKFSGVMKPIKIISVQDISVMELHDKILELVQNEDPNYKKIKKKRR